MHIYEDLLANSDAPVSTKAVGDVSQTDKYRLLEDMSSRFLSEGQSSNSTPSTTLSLSESLRANLTRSEDSESGNHSLGLPPIPSPLSVPPIVQKILDVMARLRDIAANLEKTRKDSIQTNQEEASTATLRVAMLSLTEWVALIDISVGDISDLPRYLSYRRRLNTSKWLSPNTSCNLCV